MKDDPRFTWPEVEQIEVQSEVDSFRSDTIKVLLSLLALAVIGGVHAVGLKEGWW